MNQPWPWGSGERVMVLWGQRRDFKGDGTGDGTDMGLSLCFFFFQSLKCRPLEIKAGWDF